MSDELDTHITIDNTTILQHCNTATRLSLSLSLSLTWRGAKYMTASWPARTPPTAMRKVWLLVKPFMKMDLVAERQAIALNISNITYYGNKGKGKRWIGGVNTSRNTLEMND